MQATYFIDSFLLKSIYPGSDRTIQRIHRQIKDTYNKKPHQSISIFELAHYEGTSLKNLASFLNITLPKHLPEVFPVLEIVQNVN